MKQILIDAAYPEETRVAVIKDGTIQNIDRDALSVNKLVGNVYLAKVTRVEPSLQAAFVDYGGSRHGFLPFADISPEYYQIAEDEKLALMEVKREDIANYEQAMQAREQEANNALAVATTTADAAEIAPEAQLMQQSVTPHVTDTLEHTPGFDSELPTNSTANTPAVEIISDNAEHSSNNPDNNSIEDYLNVIDGTELDNVPIATPAAKTYQIQDVIKAGQMIIVQVIKEERGAKGAALTTYLSLAGRYCVFMPNTPGRGGISKKIENIRDRKILKEILGSFLISPFSSAIIRTAGIGHRPEDIYRDYEYLKRLWEAIRTLAAESTEPCFLHDEDDVIKRCIRDIYDEEIDEIAIEGNEAFNEIKRQFQLILPKAGDIEKIKKHNERRPIFDYYGVEKQFSELYERRVLLPSGGSLVIDITEALVAIDVNSGKTTSERTIEETAVKTNVEAAYEIARQARLRNLAGLIVVDFIDMYEERNRRIVEKTLRDATANDRAKIQILKISGLGLLEMSRQRLAASFFESSSMPCSCCGGTGVVLSPEIVAISILRSVRNACSDNKAKVIHVNASGATISYILNYKRENISSMERTFNIYIFLHADDSMGEKGFEVRKTRTLSDSEQRDLLMKVSTAKIDSEKIEAECQDETYEITAVTNNELEPAREPSSQKNRDTHEHPRNNGERNREDKIQENYLRYKQEKTRANPGILSTISNGLKHLFGSTKAAKAPERANESGRSNQSRNNRYQRNRRNNNRRNNNRRPNGNYRNN